jgi:hypothetical protein
MAEDSWHAVEFDEFLDAWRKAEAKAAHHLSAKHCGRAFWNTHNMSIFVGYMEDALVDLESAKGSGSNAYFKKQLAMARQTTDGYEKQLASKCVKVS